MQPNVSPTSTVLLVSSQGEYSSQVVDISQSGTVIQVHDLTKVSNESYGNQVASDKLTSSSVELADVWFKPSDPAYSRMPTSDVSLQPSDFAHSQLLSSDKLPQLSESVSYHQLYPDASIQPSESAQFNDITSDVQFQPSSQVNRIQLTGSKKPKDKVVLPPVHGSQNNLTAKVTKLLISNKAVKGSTEPTKLSGIPVGDKVSLARLPSQLEVSYEKSPDPKAGEFSRRLTSRESGNQESDMFENKSYGSASNQTASDSVPIITTDVFDRGTDPGTVLDLFDNVSCHQIYRIGNLEIPVLNEINEINKTPTSIGYVGATISISKKLETKVYICVDTGADLTVCTSQFLIHHFGEAAMNKVEKKDFIDPDLKSATGHPLQMMGTIKVNITLGTYTFRTKVLVYKHDKVTFLLGNDCVYDRLIYNAGRTISFVDPIHAPVPIKYFKPFKFATTINYCSIAPNTSALIEVQVSKPHGIPNPSVLISPVQDQLMTLDGSCSHLADTVTTVNENGTAYTWVENNTEDQLDIFPNVQIAEVTVVTEQVNSVLKQFVTENYVPEQINTEIGSDQTTEHWSIEAMRALQHRLPVSLKVRPE